ncbi:MAG: EVE domain-containing protein [Pseudomonadota bacterium]
MTTAKAKKAPAKKATAKKSSAKKTTPAAKPTGAQYWLFKSEPFKYSWDDLKAEGDKGGEWDGVRNYQARNFMRDMKLGDLAFFYHSNEGLEVVGICEVCALAHPDTTTDDERWECVDVRAVCPVPKPVKLADVKANPKLADMALVTSMRLSVQPVKPDEWKEVCRMAGITSKAIKEAQKNE